jgi:hypothetical protein
MKRLTMFVIGIAVISFSSLALAEEPRTINIKDPDTLKANQSGPGMGKVVLSNLPDIGNLIDVRSDFDDRIVNSGDDI